MTDEIRPLNVQTPEEPEFIPGKNGGRLIPFKKGNNANPGGRNGFYGECLTMARKASPEAVRRLIELMGHDDPRVATVACTAILDRAWGKPQEKVKEAVGGKSPLDVRMLTEEQRRAFAAAITSGALKPPEDGE